MSPIDTLLPAIALGMVIGGSICLMIDYRRRKSLREFQTRRLRKALAPCPTNANHDTSPFSSTQDLWCHDCRLFHPWPLKPDQPPLQTSSRDTRRAK